MESTRTFLKQFFLIIVLVLATYFVVTRFYHVGLFEKVAIQPLPVTQTSAPNNEPNVSGVSALKTINANGNNCDVLFTVENPFVKGEYALATGKGCANKNQMYSLFIQDGATVKPILESYGYNSQLYPYPTNNQKELMVFLDADTLLYSNVDGEGDGCQSGARVNYNTYNLSTRVAKTVATGSISSSCHDPKADSELVTNVCYDTSEQYRFGNDSIVFSVTCAGPTENGDPKIVALSFNGKQVTARSILKPDYYTFSGITTTIALLQGDHLVTFLFGDTLYVLDPNTGKLMQ
ncbi:MAG: hypothetical protein WCG55_04445 [bacterium]